jgi:uncharacterized 2Fe-2S/4Fe-4S cluster protein (DUF4445 family)
MGPTSSARLAAGTRNEADAERLQRLALASINQAVDALNLSETMLQRVERVTIVGNAAMHHLLARLPLGTLAELPFQPHGDGDDCRRAGADGRHFPARSAGDTAAADWRLCRLGCACLPGLFRL